MIHKENSIICDACNAEIIEGEYLEVFPENDTEQVCHFCDGRCFVNHCLPDSISFSFKIKYA